eukprot:maker-scaffold556_size137522-snap-gene-0.37 protein:Tk02043 transcript:maker-scaffold556_size137522-snap-gene-0.37-mRNA-1 annotation:"chitotriosidase-1 isoform x2"
MKSSISPNFETFPLQLNIATNTVGASCKMIGGQICVPSLLTAALLVLGASRSRAQSTDEHNKTVACYFENWSFYRPSPVKFDIDSIDTSLCTHGIYVAADIDNSTWTIFAADPWYDLAPADCEPGYCNYDSYRRFTALQDDNFTPILSIGGWTSSPTKFSTMARDPIKRGIFVDSVLPFLFTYGFGGMEIRWEFPGQGIGSHPDDKIHFSKLVADLKKKLSLEDMTLMVSINVQLNETDVGYDFEDLSQHVDFFNLATFDFNFFSDSRNYTGHHAPLMGRVEESEEDHPGFQNNVVEGVNLVMDRGAPAEKILLGIAGQARGFTLEDVESDGLYCPAAAPNPAGPFTAIPGYWAYFEVLEAMTADELPLLPEATPQAWHIVRDDCILAPYMTNGPYWIGYDDPISVGIKSRYAKFAQLGGVVFSSLDGDDFKGLYSRPYPLLSEINRQLATGDDFDPNNFECGVDAAPICDVFEFFDY